MSSGNIPRLHINSSEPTTLNEGKARADKDAHTSDARAQTSLDCCAGGSSRKLITGRRTQSRKLKESLGDQGDAAATLRCQENGECLQMCEVAAGLSWV